MIDVDHIISIFVLIFIQNIMAKEAHKILNIYQETSLKWYLTDTFYKSLQGCEIVVSFFHISKKSLKSRCSPKKLYLSLSD